MLRFSPTAWAKLLFLRDVGETEIGGFGIAPADDLLFVADIRLVKQTCTWVSAEFDDQSIAGFFDAQVDLGRRPEQFFRLFMHTHPGNSPQPSGTDEETFGRVFGRTDWAVMFILARGGKSYARLRYNVGPGVDVALPVELDFSLPFAASDWELWQEEYLSNVQLPPPESKKKVKACQQVNAEQREAAWMDDRWQDDWGESVDFERYEQETEYDCIGDI